MDKTIKVHIFNNDTLRLISVINEKIDNSRGLFKRILFEDDLLYVFTKNNTVSVYAYPFNTVHLHKKIGPLNSSVVKVLTGEIKSEPILLICTKKGAYLFNNDIFVCFVDNACFMAITDAVIYKNTVFLSSMDGFICTVRLD